MYFAYTRQFFVFMLMLLFCAPSIAKVPSSAVKSLERFFSSVKTYKADFQQVVMDASLNVMQESTGTLWLKRPNKFRWNYRAPYKQEVVADGRLIWVYDIDLKQASARRMEGGLGQTPAMLLAGRGKLSADFTLSEMGAQGSLLWVQMTPKSKDGGFETIRIGFEGNKLRMLEMIDQFEHTTRITLNEAQENTAMSEGIFQFIAPDGVDTFIN